jgi:hypothetical protein
MRPFLRFRPVVSRVDLVAVGPRFPCTGELPAAANGGATVSTPNSSGRALLPLLHLIPTTHLKINGQNRLIPLRGDFC